MFDDFDHDAASNPLSRLSRYISEHGIRRMRSRCFAQPIELEARFARSSTRPDTSMPTSQRTGDRPGGDAGACPRRNEIKDAEAARMLLRPRNRVEPAFVQTDRPLDRRLLSSFWAAAGLLFGLFLRRQPGDASRTSPR